MFERSLSALPRLPSPLFQRATLHRWLTPCHGKSRRNLRHNGKKKASQQNMVLEPLGPQMVLEPTVGASLETVESLKSSRVQRAKKRKAQDLWEPGQNARGWIGRGRWDSQRIAPQTQVLLVNGYQRLKKLSFPTRRQLQGIFPPLRGTTAATTLAAQILAGLLAIPARTVEETVRHVQRHRFQPSPRKRVFRKARWGPPGPEPAPAASAGGLGPEPAASAGDHGPGPSASAEAAAEAEIEAAEAAEGPAPAPAASAPAAPAASSEGGRELPPAPCGFVNTMRAAMFVASHGLPKSSLSDILWLISAAGGVLHGPQGRGLCDKAEHAAAACLVAATLAELRRPLPGTGRPPDVEVIADSGSIGSYFRSTRDTIFFLGVVYSVAEPPYSRESLLACINAGADERGPATVAKIGNALDALGIAEALGLSPRSWKTWWNMFVAAGSADGALVRGGPTAKHQSTAAMNKI